MDLTPMRRWCELKKKKTELNARVKEINEEQASLAEKILNIFMEEQIPGIKVEGQNLHTRKETMVGVNHAVTVVDEETGAERVIDGMEMIVQGMRENGYEHLVKVNASNLKSLVISFTNEGEPIPAWLEPYVNVTQTTKLAALSVKSK